MENICKDCFKDPNSHSFTLLCMYDNNNYLFYTRIADSKKYDDTEGILKHYENYLNFINPEKWTWIIDFDNVELKHSLEIKTSIGLCKLVKKFGKVDKIFIINQNMFLKKLLPIVKPFIGDLYKKLTIYSKNDKNKFLNILQELKLEDEYINFFNMC